MKYVTVAELRRFADQLGHLPDEALVNMENLVKHGRAFIYDEDGDIHVEVRFSLEDLHDE